MIVFAELQRRNVIRMAGLYLVGAWLIVQIAGTVLPMFDVSASMVRGVVIALAVGFLPAMVFAWVFELTPEGFRRDADVPPERSIAPQTARRMDRLIMTMLAILIYINYWHGLESRWASGDKTRWAGFAGYYLLYFI